MKKLGLLLTLFCLPTLLLACQKKPERTGGPAGPFYDHYFYQAFRDQLQIIDIADPANPVYLGNLNSNGRTAYNGWVAGRYLYVTEYDMATTAYQFGIYSLEDPEQPTLVRTLPTTNFNGLIFYDGLGYQIDAEQQLLRVMDYSDPLQPRELGAVANAEPGYPQVSGDYAMVADFDWCGRASMCLFSVNFFAIDGVGDLRFVQHVPIDTRQSSERFFLRGHELFYHAISIDDDLQFHSTVTVLDLSAPLENNLVGTHQVEGQPYYLSDSLLLVQAYSQTNIFNMQLYDSSDGANFIPLGNFDLPGYPFSAYLREELLYMRYNVYDEQQYSNGEALAVVDLTDPMAPEIIADLLVIP
ncbi:MAG: hypothetical protein H6651_13425 [Ardenticatenales bacterium]|nr:hypothetical protein [Ardenticatenales bacterium]